MPCCPKPDRTPLDPEREGLSDEDLARFGGDDLPYCEFDDESEFGAATERKRSPMAVAAPAIAAGALVVFVLVFVV